MKTLFTLLLILSAYVAKAQQNFAFTHITTEDGMGLASNLVTSLHQDEKGFIWVGTGNGLQRFDGSKFIDINTSKAGSDNLEHSRMSQIIPADSGKLVLAMFSLREFGLFDPSTFTYKKIPIKPLRNISPRAELRLWKDSEGEIYMNIQNYGILHYKQKENSFIDDRTFSFPAGWVVNVMGVHEDIAKQQYWFACDSGLCIYDKSSKQMWYKRNNPRNLSILKNERIQEALTQVYVDKQKRTWLFGRPQWAGGEQIKYCVDSTGRNYLKKDTLGLNYGIPSMDYRFFYETKRGGLFIYGFNVLVFYDKSLGRFQLEKSVGENENININYESVFQILEDREGNIWIATNQGIYYSAAGSVNSAIINRTFNSTNGPTAINDILELPNGEIWFTSFRYGVTTTDQFLNKIKNNLYKPMPPANWPVSLQKATLQTLTMLRQVATGYIWIGCTGGVIMIYDPLKKTTKYLHPPELDNSAVNFITDDKDGQLWIATEAGRVVRWRNNQFTVVQEVGTVIHKIFIDKDGWLWVTTRGNGLYAIDRSTGIIKQHYTKNGGKNSLYNSIGTDIEELQNGLIVLAAGALHFIDKKNGNVSILKYENGLPSNTLARVRTDNKGYLWMITSNGLCSYNPNNNRITPYSRRDGIVLAEQTISADEITTNGRIIFGGSNFIIMFDPAVFRSTALPPSVTITDFKISNRSLPIDSLLRNNQIKLNYDDNSLSIYFASLSYREKDKLAYYYKMDGIDKDWVKADRSYFINYSFLPPGAYSFKIYCENIEGERSSNVTTLNIKIKPPFWGTWWFISSLVFVIALLIYEVHIIRVSRLMAIETLRNSVARDLHDDMGSTLSTINILSSMAISKINVDKVKTASYLNKISENSQRMMEAMDDIVWSIKPSNDSMQKITARMREFATNVLEAKEIILDFVVDENVFDVKMNMQVRRDFFLVFKEAVNNAAKYSQASKIFIQVTMRNRKLLLIVKDDGLGFDVAEADGNGLGNMQKRADAMDGNVTIQTEKGTGTVVKLEIPILN